MAMNALRQHPLLFAAIALALVLGGVGIRSEEHTSELQSSQISYAVFCLKKKNQAPRHCPCFAALAQPYRLRRPVSLLKVGERGCCLPRFVDPYTDVTFNPRDLVGRTQREC